MITLLGMLIFFLLVFLPMIPDSPDDPPRPRNLLWLCCATFVSIALWYFIIALIGGMQ